MKLYPEKLAGHLSGNLLPLYWVSGDETLLVQEACDQIRSACRSQGFSERELFHVDPGFDWKSLAQSGDSLSLFAEKKIIELRLRGKPDERGRKALQHYLENPSADNLLLVVSPKLDSSAINAKWFKGIEGAGAVIQVWPVDRRQLPRWIEQRLGRHGLRAEPEALSLLADRVEGNLLAASQEIEKLSLLAGAVEADQAPLTSRMVMQSVADSSRYSTFSLIDAALQGNAERALKMLAGLRLDGSEPLMILNLLCRELRSLAPMVRTIEQGQSAEAVLSQGRVWKSRQPVVGAALRRLSTTKIYELLQQAREVDRNVKGIAAGSVWDRLNELFLQLSGIDTRLGA